MNLDMLTKPELAYSTLVLISGRALLPFPDDLPPFGSVVETPAGETGELIGWLGTQSSDFVSAKERIAVLFIYNGTTYKTAYVAESVLKVIGPQQQCPAFAAHFAVLLVQQFASEAAALSSTWKPLLPC